VVSFLEDNAASLDVAGVEAVDRARTAARALDELADTLKQSVSPVDRRFEAPLAAAVESHGRSHDVCEWVRYVTPTRNYRKPDLRWLLASAVVSFRENQPDTSTEMACRRVGGYLALLDAPLGS